MGLRAARFASLPGRQKDQMTPPLARACFFSGAHIDLSGRLSAPARPGQSNPGRVSAHPGGASLNAASAAAALGLACDLASPIGDDANGERLRATLAERAVGDALFVVPGAATGSYTAIIEPDGALAIGLADLDLYEQAPAEAYLSAGDGAAQAADLWFLPANLSAQALERMVEAARDTPGRRIVLAAVSAAKAGRLAGVSGAADLLFAGRAEAAALTGLADASPVELGRALRAAGARAGIVSDGPHPLYWWAGEEEGLFSAPPVVAIADVNGAGDALAGAVLAGLARGMAFVEAVRLGMAAARLTLARLEPFDPQLRWARLKREAISVTAMPIDQPPGTKP